MRKGFASLVALLVLLPLAAYAQRTSGTPFSTARKTAFAACCHCAASPCR